MNEALKGLTIEPNPDEGVGLVIKLKGVEVGYLDVLGHQVRITCAPGHCLKSNGTLGFFFPIT